MTKQRHTFEFNCFFLIAGCIGSLGYWQSLAKRESKKQHQWYCIPKESQVHSAPPLSVTDSAIAPSARKHTFEFNSAVATLLETTGHLSANKKGEDSIYPPKTPSLERLISISHKIHVRKLGSRRTSLECRILLERCITTN